MPLTWVRLTESSPSKIQNKERVVSGPLNLPCLKLEQVALPVPDKPNEVEDGPGQSLHIGIFRCPHGPCPVIHGNLFDFATI